MSIRLRGWFVGLGLVAMGVGSACKKDEPPTPAPANGATGSAPSSAPTASVAPASSTSSAKAAPAKPSKDKTPIPKSVAQAYAAGLKKGRAETLAKRYDAAIAAFDEALKALPGDPRALSERGYAKLVAGKTEEAKKDFTEALAATKEPKLLAQIHYNLGLVAEKLGKAEDAKVSFARSNALAPSKAAATKAGASVCAALVSFVPGGAKVVKDYKGMFDALAVASKATSKVASESAAKEVLASRIDETERANVVSFPPEDDTTEWQLHPYLKTPEGLLVATDAASSYYDMPCGGEVHAKVQESSGLTLVRVDHAPGMRIPVCETDAGELEACGDGAMPVTSACGTSDVETTIVVFDLAKKSAVARVSFSADNKVPTVTLEGRKLKVDGAGCSVAHDL